MSNLYKNRSVKTTTYCFARCMQDCFLTRQNDFLKAPLIAWQPHSNDKRFSNLYAKLSYLAAGFSFTLTDMILLSVPLAKK